MTMGQASGGGNMRNAYGRSRGVGRVSAPAAGVSNAGQFPRPGARQFPIRSRELLLLCRASLVKLRDTGDLTDAEFAARKAKPIRNWGRALTRGARSSVPAVVYPVESREHPERAEPAHRLTGRPVSQEEAPHGKDPREGRSIA